jgi:hypothetical protein
MRRDAAADGDTHPHTIAAADRYGYARADGDATADGNSHSDTDARADQYTHTD